VFDVNTLGRDWLLDYIANMQENIEHITPTEFNEQNRYLPESVTSIPGYIRYDVNPFMREILDCCDVNSPVREVNLMKGVQITYSTLLESVALYYMCFVKTVPMMYMTADKELATARIENNFIPMINQSGFGHIIRSSDLENTRKSGKTKSHIQWEGGGYLVPFGARNADKMRSYSIMVMLKDEIDAWPKTVGKDGDPDALSDDRCSGYWERRKIFRGSTPLIKGQSKIEAAYKRGDQRKYMVLCIACGYPQELRWSGENEETGKTYGFSWDLDNGVLQLDSVRYLCANCGHAHYEHDKEKLFSEGAHWKPTAQPVQPQIRSYHLPALYSPIGMQPWYKAVALYLSAFDTEEKKVRDIGAYQVFYNNVLAQPFAVLGSKINFVQVSSHRRAIYHKGQIPNKYALKFSGSRILLLTCTVDVHKSNLAVAVFGWTVDAKSYLIDYTRFEVDKKDAECGEPSSPVWGRLRELIEEKEYTADDGDKYKIAVTLIDSGYSNATVSDFCMQYESGVYPILGRDRTAKVQTIKEFAEFRTQAGGIGFRILVDHYKDRLAPILRREWIEDSGKQNPYHFNAPLNTTDKELKELTVETRRERTDERGNVSYFWHRPGNAANELWDLLVYGHAAVEIVAYQMCIQKFELENIDWQRFWAFIDENRLYFADV
jgi:phage terminase large subunit GpA-like protein